jgi:hypothetical protein
LAVQGRTYEQIATEVGYANRGTAHRVVQQALRQRQDKGVAALREVESARLDALQTAIWERALSGDLDALWGCGRLIERKHDLVSTVQADRAACYGRLLQTRPSLSMPSSRAKSP